MILRQDILDEIFETQTLRDNHKLSFIDLKEKFNNPPKGMSKNFLIIQMYEVQEIIDNLNYKIKILINILKK